jgi:hypothetical protein
MHADAQRKDTGVRISEAPPADPAVSAVKVHAGLRPIGVLWPVC